MISKKWIEIILTLILLAVSVWIIFESYKMTLGSFHDPGPGFLPFSGGSLMGILSLTNLIKLLKSYMESPPAFASWNPLIRVIYAMIITFVTALLFEILGYLITASLFMIFSMRLVDEERWVKLLVVTFCTVALSYSIFTFVLQSQLPVGLLGF